MIRTTLRIVLGLAAFSVAATALAATPAAAQNQHMEVIHHPNYDKSVFMPFVPAIKIKSGKGRGATQRRAVARATIAGVL
jgi:hypothetical protein